MTPNVARLERLCEVLVRVDPKHFDLDYWAGPDQYCGTTACAVGFAALDPELRAQGLTLTVLRKRFFRSKHEVTAEKLADVADLRFNKALIASPSCQGYRGYAAVSVFFDLSRKEVRWLFSPEAYPADERRAPGAVVARITALLDKTQAAPKLEPEAIAACQPEQT